MCPLYQSCGVDIHKGHSCFRSNHRRMQASWNEWKHGSECKRAPFPSDSRQIGHSWTSAAFGVHSHPGRRGRAGTGVPTPMHFRKHVHMHVAFKR